MAADSSDARVKTGEVDVNTLLQKLRLNEAEREEVVLAREERGSLPEVKWLAVAKLLTVKQFSEQSLISTMHAAWNTAREISFRPIAKNLFMVQAHYLGDWKRIMEEGPWLFCECALMLEEYDGASMTPTVEPCRVQAWIQIHKIPPLFRTEKIIRQLAGRVGEVIEVEVRAVLSSSGEFHRARVNLLATKPLSRFVTLAPEGQESMLLQVKYEKVARFCAFYGKMGHTHLEYDTGEHVEDDLQFGEWMIATSDTWRPGSPRVRGNVNPDKGGARDKSTSAESGSTGGFWRAKHTARGGARSCV